MLTLEPGSLCDVCADEYGPRNLPHSIPCGHVLCLPCCTSIIEKTLKVPVCPFCREQFSHSGVRKIRIDFTPGAGAGSGWSTPRRSPLSPRAPLVEEDYFPIDQVLLKGNPAVEDVKRFEARVMRVASQKTSLEEVTTLQHELQEWVGSDMTYMSLYLSSMLLRAIISNQSAFDEERKAARNAEHNLKHRVADLEADLHKQTAHMNQKASESQSFRTDLSRYRTMPPAASPTRPSGVSPPTSPPSTRVSSPTGPTPPNYLPSLASPLSRLHHGHTRSASVAPPRSTTPAAAPLRATTPAIMASHRSATPSPQRHATPNPSHIPHRATTPAPPPHPVYRTTTPAPNSPPVSAQPMRKARTMSMSTGQGVEHARWYPPQQQQPSPPPVTLRPAGPRLAASRG